TLSAPSATAITLSYRVTGGSATQTAQASGGGDIGGKAAGSVRFVLTRTGTTAVQKSINLPVWSDTVAESDDTVDVTLSADALPPGVSISHATGTGTVLDDDAPVTSVPVPNSMAALGDSFSRGYNACSSAGDCTGVSWSTGTDPGVDSHYTRILDVNPAIAGHNNTDAMDGAPMASLDSQAQQAVSQNVDYVTIEIGGADICKSDESLMTPASAFQAQFQQAMTTLTSGLPNARVFVASIPDFMRTWEIAKDLPAARTAWASFQSFCATVTANPLVTDQANTDRRQRVRQRESDFNTALATVCAQFSNCRFDDDAVFNWKYSLSDLSTLDYFHPSYAWQTGLGALTYSAGFDW
ncbi:MAG: GDSL-type esterase/lipase family protein, partial [Acidimicrobiia bacterium]